jgi:hypothetical protein
VNVNCGAVLPFALFVHVFPLRLADGIIQSGGVKVKGLTVLIIVAIVPAGLILFGLTDLNISIADTALSTTKQSAVWVSL